MSDILPQRILDAKRSWWDIPNDTLWNLETYRLKQLFIAKAALLFESGVVELTPTRTDGDEQRMRAEVDLGFVGLVGPRQQMAVVALELWRPGDGPDAGDAGLQVVVDGIGGQVFAGRFDDLGRRVRDVSATKALVKGCLALDALYWASPEDDLGPDYVDGFVHEDLKAAAASTEA